MRAARADDLAGSNLPPGWHMGRSGSDIVLTSDNVPAGDVFTMTVMPETALGDSSLDDWFSAQMESDAPQIGTLVQGGTVSSKMDRAILFCVRGFRTSDGAERVAAYSGIRRPGGHAVLVRILSSTDRAAFEPNLKIATAIVAALAKTGAGSSETATEPDRSPADTLHLAKPQLSDWERKRMQYTTRPGAGVKPSQIAGIYTHSTMRMGVGGYMYFVYEPILVLRDGTYYEDLDVPPADFDIAAARKLRPKAWGRWRRTGGKFETWNEKKGWEEVNWTGPFSGAAPGERLSGSFTHLGGGGNTAYGGGTVIAVSNSLTFYADGHFSGGSSVGASSHEPMQGGGVAVTSNRDYAGTYKLNGYTLELDYADGRVDRRSFVFMDNKKDALYLNGVSFLKDGSF